MDKIFLWAVSLFDGIFEKAGVDIYQLKEILRVKLLIDGRRPPALAAGRGRQMGANGKARTPGAVIFGTLVMGVLYALLLFFFKKPLMGQTVYFSIFMVLMCLTLITDFTNVLFDVRDQFIIIPRPVNDRTVAFARILHITIYVMKLALLQGLPGIIVMAIVDGPLAAPLFVLQIIEATLLSIFIVNVIYLLLMKSVSPQRFKDIIAYFQIAFSITIFLCYYLLPRLINMSVLANFSLLQHQWAYYLPPVWIASLNETLLHPGRSGFLAAVMAVVGISIPLAGIWVVAKVLAPGFNRSLSMIALSDGAASPAKAKTVQKAGMIDRLANLLAPEPVENAGFRITGKLAARSRDFKMKVYPQFVFVPVYFVYSALNSARNDVGDRYAIIQHSKLYFALIYMCIMVLAAIIPQISNTDKYKAAWVYYALPINKPGKILAGMYKAIIALYFVPYFAVILIACIIIWGPTVINDALLGFIIVQIFGILMAMYMVKGLPFSRPPLTKQGGGRIIITFLVMGFGGVLGFCHYLLSQWELVIWIAIIPAAALYMLMFRYYRKQTWDNIEIGEVG